MKALCRKLWKLRLPQTSFVAELDARIDDDPVQIPCKKSRQSDSGLIDQ